MADELSAKERSRLLELPTELLIAIFASAPSFSTVTNLAATCHQLQLVWKGHITTIYDQVAARSIPCLDALRHLIADQGSLAAEATVTIIDEVASIVKISNNGHDLVEAHDKAMKMYPHCDPQVPSKLSPTETTRFIEAHYQLWGLLHLTEKDRKERIETMDLRPLTLLSDFLCNFRATEIEDPVLTDIISNNPGICRLLQHRLRRQRNKVFLELNNRPYRPVEWTPYEQCGRYAWWCDGQQEVLEKMLDGSLFRRE